MDVLAIPREYVVKLQRTVNTVHSVFLVVHLPPDSEKTRGPHGIGTAEMLFCFLSSPSIGIKIRDPKYPTGDWAHR